MKRFLFVLAFVCLMIALVSSASARDPANRGLRPAQPWTETELPELVDPSLQGLYEEAAVDTYCIVWYNFEHMNWQGWTRLDRTAQEDTFFHVDDFAGLGGGDFGRLAPLEGTKSMWCGARANPGTPYVCSFMKAPGYGNGWDQSLTSASRAFIGSVDLSYKLMWDCEPDYDFVRVEYDAGNDDWQVLASYTGNGGVVEQLTLPMTQIATKLRFHFVSDGAWSDEDGLLNTDGACIVDSIRVSDSGGYSNFEDFESAPVGAGRAGIWEAGTVAAFGLHSGMKSSLMDKDPCGENLSTQIAFFLFSGDPIPSPSYPGLYETPFCKGSGGTEAPCQDEAVVSPIIDLRKYSTACNSTQDGTIPEGDLPSLGGLRLKYTVYVDNPLENLVFWNWHVRGFDAAGCPGPWLGDDILLYYWDNGVYSFDTKDLGSFVHGDSIQIALGIVDMCDIWYLAYGDCASHTPAPWYDNVRIYRFKSDGPQWYSRDFDLFQDNFPGEEFNLESYVRADAAIDINANDNPVIRPGDSIVIGCSSHLGGGIAADPGGGTAVYMHVKGTYIGPAPAKPKLFGPSLQGTYGWYKSDDGTWTIIQGDTARANGGTIPNWYMFDLNDSLFTRGYQVDYYFTALSNAGIESALPKWCRSYGPYYEFTCLPTKNSEVLFVDDFTGRGSFAGSAENYWMPTFLYELASPNCNVDKYDVNAPTSGASNGPGSRAKTQQLIDWYKAIVWDCGDLESVTISDGTVNSDKSNDCQMLINWFEQSEHVCGLWICGDNVAHDLNGLASTQALTLMSTWCGVDFVATSYFDETGGRTGGGIVTPLLTGEADAGIFVHTLWEVTYYDKLYAYGGCPLINRFDVLEKTANGMYALSYPVHDATNRYAAIASSTINPAGFEVRTMWFGFSLQYIRDDVLSAPIDRFEMAKNVFDWMQFVTNPLCCYAGAEVPSTYKLSQNFPNPCNPSTTIKFDMKGKGPVTLKIYNVAGQLVRTLVDDVRDAGTYSISWDGRNNLGTEVASGIYFYKMDARNFSQTRKMVLLR